jgi:suppressor of G2 allele of SKP1
MAAALALANAAFVDEDYAVALQHYDAAVASDPSSADALAKRAACHLKLARHAHAAADAAAACLLAPSVAGYRRAGLAHFGLDDFGQARTAFQSALDLSVDAAPGEASCELRRWVRKCSAELAPATDASPAYEPAPNPFAPPAATPGKAGPSSIALPPDPSKIRHEWYQTEREVVVSVLARQAPVDGTRVSFGAARARVSIDFGPAAGGAMFERELQLYAPVEPRECRCEFGFRTGV